MTFKPGAFLPGKPVQPVLLRYYIFPLILILDLKIVFS